MKIILNKCYGGFDISTAGYKLYARKKNKPLYIYERSLADFRYLKKVSEGETPHIPYYFFHDMGDTFDINEAKKHNNGFIYLDTDCREDPTLIEVVEELGEEANGTFADLEVVEIPDGIEYTIHDDDGIETLCEVGHTW